MKKVVILETVHFQYGLTLSELFQGFEKFFIVTDLIHKQMQAYDVRLCNGSFNLIDSVAKDYQNIIQICNDNQVDLFLVSPIFHDYKELVYIEKSINAKSGITIHNLNSWINPSFRSFKSLKERKWKLKAVKNFDYIIVEDFIYNYVKNINNSLFKKYNFLYIPFTIFHPQKLKTYHKDNPCLKVVLPGSIHHDRRRYEDVLGVIFQMANEQRKITFSFAGPPLEEYGRNVIRQLDEANKILPGVATYFPEDGEENPMAFKKEMETSDIVLSTSTKLFHSLGTTEYIGKTKPTAAIHDMMSYELPGLMPEHLIIPEKLKGSVLNYSNQQELYDLLIKFLENEEELKNFQHKAKENSLNFTPEKIRKHLPFFD